MTDEERNAIGAQIINILEASGLPMEESVMLLLDLVSSGMKALALIDDTDFESVRGRLMEKLMDSELSGTAH